MAASTSEGGAIPRGRAALADPRFQRILGRSALYEALALGFAYPTESTVARLSELLADLRDHEIVTLYGLGPRLAAIEGALSGAAMADLQLEHNRLFLGQVLCSPHETEYERDTFAKAAQLADIAGFYTAWGLQAASSRRTMPDFVGTELEFMAAVTRREAYAVFRGWNHRRRVAVESQRAFLQAHLGRWVNAFATDVRDAARDASGGRYFAAVARLCEQFVVMDIATLAVTPSALEARIPRPDDDRGAECYFDSPSTEPALAEALSVQPRAEAGDPALPPFPPFG